MNKKEIISLIILIAVVAFGIYRYQTREYTEVKSQYLMDTIVEISASSRNKTVGRQIDTVFNLIKELETKLSEYDEGSLIWNINNSDTDTFEMDADLYNMLAIADSLYKISNGAFDITIKPVFDLWHFDADSLAVPQKKDLDNKLKLVGFDKIRFDENTLYKPKGMELSFGAIAKGYIIDKARSYMIERGLQKGYINSRSSICFWGSKMSQVVYIQHPRKMEDYIATFRVMDKSIATSGDYQQFFELDGIRYHHILNPKTGYPVQDMYSITVIHPSAAWADGLSTALFLMQPSEGADFINSIEDCDAVIYYNQNGSPVSLKTNGMKLYNISEKI